MAHEISDEAIEQHIKTYRGIFKETGEVTISELVDSHINMQSVLHEHASKETIDTAAFIYSLLRLPPCISHTENILLGQSYTVFKKNGYGHIDGWNHVLAVGRRRKMFFDGEKTLAVYIASVTDVDDLMSLLTAYQIEWNKFHKLLREEKYSIIPSDDEERLRIIIGEHYDEFLQAIKRHPLDFHLKLLSGSYIEYMRTTQMWWNHIRETVKDIPIEHRPVYFISSNTHSLVNILTRTAVTSQDELIHFIHGSDDQSLKTLWHELSSGDSPRDKEYFFHYVGKKYEKENLAFAKRKEDEQKALGIRTIEPYHYLDVPAQIIEMKSLANRVFHSRFSVDTSSLVHSNAVIINIDYPLGWAAYQILSEITKNVEYISGIYIMGKAAILHGEIGDVLLPSQVFDEHTKNYFRFPNALTIEAISSWYKTGTVYPNQKNISVKGTFFENRSLLNQWYEQEYSSVEMEGGPYLNAIYENVFYNRYVEQQILDLPELPFDFGMAYYASDTPNSKAKNLGSRNLSYDGIECTYGITMSIIERIIECERKQIRSY